MSLSPDRGRVAPASAAVGPWSRDKLAAVAGETEARLSEYADAGLLHRTPNGEFDPDSLHRVRLIQFARRGVSDEKLAAAVATQGDLLEIVDELVPVGDATVSLVDAARELGLDDTVIDELSEILDWDDGGSGTASDVATCMSLCQTARTPDAPRCPNAVGPGLR